MLAAVSLGVNRFSQVLRCRHLTEDEAVDEGGNGQSLAQGNGQLVLSHDAFMAVPKLNSVGGGFGLRCLLLNFRSMLIDQSGCIILL